MQYAGIEPAYRIERIRSLSSVEKHVTLSLSCSVNLVLFAMAQRVMVEIFYVALCDLVVHYSRMEAGVYDPTPPTGAECLDTLASR